MPFAFFETIIYNRVERKGYKQWFLNQKQANLNLQKLPLSIYILPLYISIMPTVTLVKNYEYYANADLTKYAGKWIAILNKKVIAYANTIKELSQKIENQKIKETPFIIKIPTKEKTIW